MCLLWSLSVGLKTRKISQMIHLHFQMQTGRTFNIRKQSSLRRDRTIGRRFVNDDFHLIICWGILVKWSIGKSVLFIVRRVQNLLISIPQSVFIDYIVLSNWLQRLSCSLDLIINSENASSTLKLASKVVQLSRQYFNISPLIFNIVQLWKRGGIA